MFSLTHVPPGKFLSYVRKFAESRKSTGSTTASTTTCSTINASSNERWRRGVSDPPDLPHFGMRWESVFKGINEKSSTITWSDGKCLGHPTWHGHVRSIDSIENQVRPPIIGTQHYSGRYATSKTCYAYIVLITGHWATRSDERTTFHCRWLCHHVSTWLGQLDWAIVYGNCVATWLSDECPCNSITCTILRVGNGATRGKNEPVSTTVATTAPSPFRRSDRQCLRLLLEYFHAEKQEAVFFFDDTAHGEDLGLAASGTS